MHTIFRWHEFPNATIKFYQKEEIHKLTLLFRGLNRTLSELIKMHTFSNQIQLLDDEPFDWLCQALCLKKLYRIFIGKSNNESIHFKWAHDPLN